MKSKKGFFFALGMLKWFFLLVVLIVILGLLIWFGVKISSGLSAIADFLKKYFFWILGALVLIIYREVILKILFAILKIFHIK